MVGRRKRASSSTVPNGTPPTTPSSEGEGKAKSPKILAQAFLEANSVVTDMKGKNDEVFSLLDWAIGNEADGLDNTAIYNTLEKMIAKFDWSQCHDITQFSNGLSTLAQRHNQFVKTASLLSEQFKKLATKEAGEVQLKTMRFDTIAALKKSVRKVLHESKPECRIEHDVSLLNSLYSEADYFIVEGSKPRKLACVLKGEKTVLSYVDLCHAAETNGTIGNICSCFISFGKEFPQMREEIFNLMKSQFPGIRTSLDAQRMYMKGMVSVCKEFDDLHCSMLEYGIEKLVQLELSITKSSSYFDESGFEFWKRDQLESLKSSSCEAAEAYIHDATMNPDRLRTRFEETATEEEWNRSLHLLKLLLTEITSLVTCMLNSGNELDDLFEVLDQSLIHNDSLKYCQGLFFVAAVKKQESFMQRLFQKLFHPSLQCNQRRQYLGYIAALSYYSKTETSFLGATVKYLIQFLTIYSESTKDDKEKKYLFHFGFSALCFILQMSPDCYTQDLKNTIEADEHFKSMLSDETILAVADERIMHSLLRVFSHTMPNLASLCVERLKGNFLLDQVGSKVIDFDGKILNKHLSGELVSTLLPLVVEGCLIYPRIQLTNPEFETLWYQKESNEQKRSSSHGMDETDSGSCDDSSDDDETSLNTGESPKVITAPIEEKKTTEEESSVSESSVSSEDDESEDDESEDEQPETLTETLETGSELLEIVNKNNTNVVNDDDGNKDSYGNINNASDNTTTDRIGDSMSKSYDAPAEPSVSFSVQPSTSTTTTTTTAAQDKESTNIQNSYELIYKSLSSTMRTYNALENGKLQINAAPATPVLYKTDHGLLPSSQI